MKPDDYKAERAEAQAGEFARHYGSVKRKSAYEQFVEELSARQSEARILRPAPDSKVTIFDFTSIADMKGEPTTTKGFLEKYAKTASLRPYQNKAAMGMKVGEVHLLMSGRGGKTNMVSERMSHAPAEEALYGKPVFFSGARVYRPKDGVMVVTNASGLIGRKSMMGLAAVQKAALKERRELILLLDLYTDRELLDLTCQALDRHGLSSPVLNCEF